MQAWRSEVARKLVFSAGLEAVDEIAHTDLVPLPQPHLLHMTTNHQVTFLPEAIRGERVVDAGQPGPKVYGDGPSGHPKRRIYLSWRVLVKMTLR